MDFGRLLVPILGGQEKPRKAFKARQKKSKKGRARLALAFSKRAWWGWPHNKGETAWETHPGLSSSCEFFFWLPKEGQREAKGELRDAERRPRDAKGGQGSPKAKKDVGVSGFRWSKRVGF